MGLRIGGHVEKVNGKELTYAQFVERYIKKNQPVVLTGLMDDWRASTDWVSPDGQPNLRFFSTHFGKSLVQVADCGARELTDQKRAEMSVSDFIDHWLEDSAKEHGNAASCESNGKSLLYLKDWHFVKEYPKYLAYTTPLFFCDDWLNLYLDNHRMHKDPDTYQENNEISCSDYRFVYMGAKGTWTPLHADVFRSYSWSANVCGKKQWHFLSPSQHHLVFDRYMKSSIYDIFEDVSEVKFPGFKEAIWLECSQDQNEIIFVPSGWFHQVHNLEDTISINQNWFNAYNILWVWDLLLRDYSEAKEYIEDIKDICDDFEGLCQRNLAANTGMNFYDFFIFIVRFCFANLVLLCYLLRDHNPTWSSSPMAQTLALNLVSIQKIALKMKFDQGLAANIDFVDFRETLDNTDFVKLCTVLSKTYGMIHEQMIHEQWEQSCDIKKILVDGLRAFDFMKTSSSEIRTPEDLVNFIDIALAELGCVSLGENILF
ncbi:arginine-specific demethylase JMJ20 [Malania oleifera]|uniref:arginine-specific demethylase JMJ20 n=1 Tax=Malania oleifera TaxID=397392 RepID=UPI0025ADDCDC|nr:arginine-specific demethylase JMJ20 [Malania oleifera]